MCIATTRRSLFVKVPCCPLLNSEDRKIHVHFPELWALTPLVHFYIFRTVFLGNFWERGGPTEECLVVPAGYISEKTYPKFLLLFMKADSAEVSSVGLP